ncbi:hypothetical protein ACFQFC_02270 [Amorphoplanes digitatis]|uniref:hypothetical protein n=1 Tax=Actinoplanes digitatis TaxID=1868 RepID=UPI001A55B0D2|nr:hypothetical protein Adi01nite_52080 [Actinoplanes digitatis]
MRAALLAALTATLVAAFVVGPRLLAALGPGGGFDSERELSAALGAEFPGYWRSGGRDLPPGLDRAVDYWFRYHVAKAVFAALLLIVLVALGVLLWRAFRRGGRGPLLAPAGVVVVALGLFATVALMANIQGAAAPFASALPMVASGGDPAGALDQVRRELDAAATGGGRFSPPLAVMIGDFARFHVVLAVVAAVVAAVLIGVSAVLWRRFAAADRRTGRVLGSFGVLSALSSLVLVVVAAANASTAADPAPALLAFFNGGW